MMFWFGDGLTGWHPAMAVVMVLAWWLVGLGVYALVRYVGRKDRAARSATPQQVLAERFARGEIDAPEYRERLDILEGRTRPVGAP